MANQIQLQKLIGAGIAQGKGRILEEIIDFTDIEAGLKGTFKFHHPTVFDRLQIGITKTQLLQGFEGSVDVITDNIAHMTATLTYVLDESPEWFKINEIYDYEILDRVYETYNTWYRSFRTGSTETNDSGDSK